MMSEKQDKRKKKFSAREKKKLALSKKSKPRKSERELKEIEDINARCQKLTSTSVKSFKDLPLSGATLKGLKESGYTTPTEIQKESLVLTLQDRDVLGAAKTGSGKTLAFVIPILEKLFKQRWSGPDGLGALVITPTRELAYQIFEQLRKVGRYHDFSAGLVIGGKDLHFESKRIATCNIIICTPGRLLQHMDENPQFDASQLQILVLDEADRCLEMGFADQMNAILENLPKTRQTLLFSATQTRSIKDLARLSLEEPVYVSVHEHANKATPDELLEHYTICELHQKVDMLWSFIKNHRKKKILVFVQSCKQAKFLSDILRKLRAPVQVSALYGTLNQLRRMSIYNDFCEKDSGVLVATDIAARGLDFPTVDWVFQMDCPEDWKAYNHRVGRTARNKAKGQALLLLMPSEEPSMLKQLKAHKFPLEKIEVNPKKLTSVRGKIESFLIRDRELQESAKRAFQAYLKSVFLMKDKAVFNVSVLDTDAFAASLGLAVPPRVRFLRKQLQQQPGRSDENDFKAFALSDSEGSDDDADSLLKPVHRTEDDQDNEPIGDELNQSRKNKIKTKASLAKKILKKNITVNQRVVFDDEGEAVSDGIKQKLSDAGRKYETDADLDSQVTSGIDLKKAKEVLLEEDRFDREKERARVREMHKEKRRKEKEAKNKRKKQNKEGDEDVESSEESEVDLDWLPDPDVVYGGEKRKNEEDSGEDEETPAVEPKKKKKSKMPGEGALEDLADAESLALALLKR